MKNQYNQQVPIQQFLQTAFLDMWDMVMRAVGDLKSVIGVEVSLFFGGHCFVWILNLNNCLQDV